MNPAEKRSLLSKFEKLYPDPKSELNFKGTYQLVVCVILSAQCTDKKVNQVTPGLFAKYSSFKKLSEAKVSELEKIIRPINYYKTKTKNLIGMSGLVVNQHAGKLPRTHKELIALPGIGQKTANVVLNELGVVPTLPVDTHVFRVSKRLGLASGKTPEKTEEELKQEFKEKHWRNLHHWLIFHGRRVCKAQRPLCSECGIDSLCPSKVT